MVSLKSWFGCGHRFNYPIHVGGSMIDFPGRTVVAIDDDDGAITVELDDGTKLRIHCPGDGEQNGELPP